jgi:predicted SAM-dependent methyltransferase
MRQQELTLRRYRLWRDLKRRAARSTVHLMFRDLALGVGRFNPYVVREDLARRYLTGCGIEIGAGTFPLRVPPDVKVRYVDRFDRATLLSRVGGDFLGPDLDPELIPEIDVVDDAQQLAEFADASADFVIANHVLEHIEDPIGALKHFQRVTRPGGVVVLTIPDARHTFDAQRARTTVEHLLRDHREGPENSRQHHYEEWATYIEGIGEEGHGARSAEYAASDAHHHFHVWELEDFLALLYAINLDCDVIHAQANGREFAIILRKHGFRLRS